MNIYSLDVNGVFYLLRDVWILIKSYVKSAEYDACTSLLKWDKFKLCKNKTLVQKL